MRMTVSAPCHDSIRAAPSPLSSRTRTDSGAASLSRRATTSPTASSRRDSLPRPMMSVGDRPGAPSLSLNMQRQEVRGAGDAGVVVAYRLLALPLELVRRQVHVLRNE